MLWWGGQEILIGFGSFAIALESSGCVRSIGTERVGKYTVVDKAKIGTTAHFLKNIIVNDHAPNIDSLGPISYRFSLSDCQPPYPGAGHAFMNQITERNDRYRHEASQDAWTKTMEFFDKYVAKLAVPSG